MNNNTQKIKIFISYSHYDVNDKEEIEAFLSYNSVNVEIFSDSRLRPGDDWNKVLLEMRNDADIFLLLVSESFVNSETIAIELEHILTRAKADNASVLPIILSPANWRNRPFAKFQAVPREGKTVSEYSNINEAMLEIKNAVDLIIQVFRNQRAKLNIDNELKARTRTLDLSGCGLESIPVDIRRMNWLRILRLDENNIDKLSNLDTLTKLTELTISDNKIFRLENLQHLTNLQKLDLSFNKIDYIGGLDKLQKLRHLNLTGNHIEEVSGLDYNDQLHELWLGDNHIGALRNIDHLTMLESLVLDHNGLQWMEDISGLFNLKNIVLTSNRLKTLKPLISHLHQLPVFLNYEDARGLNGIFLRGNETLVEPAPEVVEKGSEAILHYFEQVENFGSQGIHVLKLILVGNSRVGKSNFSHFLRSGRIPEKSESTHLLEIKKWQSPLEDDAQNPLHINIFDFGGQDYYHDAHRMFYSYDTAYILLWDKATNAYQEVENEGDILVYENFPLSYWLESIKFNLIGKVNFNRADPLSSKAAEAAQQPAVFIVQNKIDNGEGFLDQEALSRQYNNIWSFYNLSLTERKRTEGLNEVLKDYISSLRLAGRKIVNYEIPIINHFLRGNHPLDIWSLADFSSFCKERIPANIDYKPEDADILATILNNMGLVYYDAREERSTIYTHIGRLNEQIKLVMDNARLNSEKGVFTYESLEDVAFRDEVLGLLVRNNSIIQLGSTHYLAPQFLPAHHDAPTGFFMTIFSHNQVRFAYEAYYHKSLLLNLFARYIKMMDIQPSIGIQKFPFWRNGIIVSKGEGADQEIVYVEFEKTSDKGYINIRTTKPFHKSGFEQQIAESIAELSKGWTYEKELSINSHDFFGMTYLNKKLEGKQYVFTATK